MARRRVWLFIVEGETDKTAIGLSLEALIGNERVEFDVFGSDIFGASQIGRAGADPVMRTRDIHERIKKEVCHHLEFSDYQWGDLDRLILLLDTDGSFVPDDAVTENKQLEGIRYHNDCIEVPDASHARRRNKERSSNVRKVLGRPKVTYRGKSVPVSAYFMSRNLEHALHDRPEQLEKRVKIRLARQFRLKYKDDLDGFIELLSGDISVPGDYRGSWEYIQEGTHSLERGSNLNVLLGEISNGEK